MYTILIVGGGYTGIRAAKYFADKKQKVILLSRSKHLFDNAWLQHFSADLTVRSSLLKLPPAHFIIFAAAPDERTDEDYERVYVQGTANLIEAIARNPNPALFLYLSSTGVYGEHQTGEIDDSVRPEPTSTRSKILLRAEDQVLQSGLPSAVFRLSGIYGPGRNRAERILSGKILPGSENKYMNMIHVDDIVSALQPILKSAKPGEVILGADGHPVSSHQFHAWLYEKLGLTPEQDFSFSGEKPFGKRLVNRRMKELSCHFKYPDFKTGYEAILKDLKS